MILISWLLGRGSLLILYGKRAKQDFFAEDCFLTGWMISIGLAEAAHLTAVFLGRSFSDCVELFRWELAGGGAAAALLLLADRWLSGRQGTGEDPKIKENAKTEEKKKIEKWDKKELAAGIVFLLLAGIQILALVFGGSVYRGGDMTLETVQSFLGTDAVYQVNPLTGRAYELGLPLRLKILCLPTLYGALSRMFGLSPETVVWVAAPVFVLTASYLAYGAAARFLFDGDRFGRYCFLGTVALLVWVGDCMYGMEGFGLLHSGFRGVTIRGAVLAPYTVGLVLRKKWKLVLLCILAEACMVWTLYGFGMCFLTAAGLVLAKQGLKVWRKKGRPEKKEAQV